MKPRIVNAVPDLIFESSKYNEHQDRTKDLTKCNGVWLVHEPKVWATDPFGGVTVGAHYGLVLGGVELSLKAETVVPILNQFSAGGWWYLYAKNDGSDGVAYEWRDEVPDDGIGIMLGSTHRRVAEVYVIDATPSSEQIRPFRYSDGETIYNWGANGGVNLFNYTAIQISGSTSLVDLIPPTSRVALVRLQVSHDSLSPPTNQFRAGVGTTGSAGVLPTMQLSLSGFMANEFDFRFAEGWVETDDALDVGYDFVDCNAYIAVKGYKR